MSLTVCSKLHSCLRLFLRILLLFPCLFTGVIPALQSERLPTSSWSLAPLSWHFPNVSPALLILAGVRFPEDWPTNEMTCSVYWKLPTAHTYHVWPHALWPHQLQIWGWPVTACINRSSSALLGSLTLYYICPITLPLWAQKNTLSLIEFLDILWKYPEVLFKYKVAQEWDLQGKQNASRIDCVKLHTFKQIRSHRKF